jgi:hypothetical protein
MKKYVLLIVLGTLSSLGAVFAARAETPEGVAAPTPWASGVPLPLLPAQPPCLPLDGPIGFHVSGAYLDSIAIRFGSVGASSTGTVQLKTDLVTDPNFSRAIFEGELRLKVTKAEPMVDLLSSGGVNAELIGSLVLTREGQGVVRRAAVAAGLVRDDVGYGVGDTKVCVSGIALDGAQDGHGQLYGSSLYLYLNNSDSHGAVLTF